MKDPHISIGRAAVETVTDFEAYSFEIGKAVEMRQGSDLPLLPAGSPWARPRGGEHISGGRRADKGCPICIRRSPIDRKRRAAARETKIVTAEEHNVMGRPRQRGQRGRGECCPVPVLKVGTQDTFRAFRKRGPAAGDVRNQHRRDRKEGKGSFGTEIDGRKCNEKQ